MARRGKGRGKSRGSLLPKKVPVLHVYYDLEGNYDFKDSTCGEWSVRGKKKTIRVGRSQDEPAIWAATFFHEWFHAAFNELGHMKDRDSEAKVEGLAHALMSLFTDPQGRQLLKGMLRHIPERKAL